MSAEVIELPFRQKHHEPRDRVRRRKKAEKVAVQCAVDGKLYEVEFYGEEVWQIFSVSHRARRGTDGHAIDELKRKIWALGHSYTRYAYADPAIVAAARAMLGRNVAEALRLFREASIAQLRERHARLLHEAEQVEEMIAIMQRSAVQS